MSASTGASKTQIRRLPPSLKSLVGVASSTMHLTGVTEMGTIGLVRGPFGVWSGWKREYGGLTTTSYLPICVWAIFRAPRGLKRIYTTRITHYTDPDDYATTAALAGSVDVQGSTVVATAGSETGTIPGPWDLDPDDTLDIHCDEDGSGPDTATFTAVRAVAAGSGLSITDIDGETILLSLDNGPAQVITFTATHVGDPDGAAAEINEQLVGGSAVVNTGEIDIYSDKYGTNSEVDITGGTALTELGHSVGTDNGTGNVGDITAVTAAEAKTIIEAAVVNPVTGVTVTEETGGELTITSNTTGTGSSIQIEVASTADDEFGFDNDLHSGTNGSSVTVLVADERTAAGLVLTLDIEDPSSGVADEFKEKVYKDAELVETWDNLSMTPAAPNFHEKVLNNADTGSAYITSADEALGIRPDNATGITLTGGDDGLSGLVDADFIGNAGTRSTRLLADYIALRAIPGRATAVVQPDLVSWSEETNSFAVLAGPLAQTVAGIRTYVKTTASLKGQSEYGAFYWPNVYLANPSTEVYGSDTEKVLVPAEGSVLAAIIVQDVKRGGVYEAAGGLENGQLFGVVDIETDAVYDEANRDALYPDRINIIHHMADGEPFFIDGSRTLREDGPFPSIGESRGVIYITQTLFEFVDPKRHKNINMRLLSEIRNVGTLWLRRQTELGAFFTDDPGKAFYLDTSENVNTPATMAAKELHLGLGLNMAPPAEWIYIDVTKDTRALYEALGL